MNKIILTTTSLLLLCWCNSICSMAQYQTRVLDEDIHSLRASYVDDGNVLQRPCLFLNTESGNSSEEGIVDGSDPGNTLQVTFDVFSHDMRMFSYTVKHLNHDGTPSDLNSYEYVRGYTSADIYDYAQSINTQQIYTNYRFTFPNEEMQLLVSGNYKLLIYEDGDEQQVVAEVGFCVVNPQVNIDATVRGNTDIAYNSIYQQLDIDVETANLNMRNADEVTMVVTQNNRLDNSVVVNRPTYIEPQRLRYLNQRTLIFEAGNEFRHFDTYSTYYAGYHVDRIRYAGGEYHALLEVDDVRGTMHPGAGREGTPYLTENDANGQWVVNCEKTDDVDIEAEYMWVHFCLPVKQPIMNGHVYVGGDAFGNYYGANNRMEYDAENKCYYLYAYLKQGGYDYMYYVVREQEQGTPKVSLLDLEGSHWQTQNNYTVRIYHRPFGGRYDRLVGYEVL